MKLPRDLSGPELIDHLKARWSYRKVHQVGSHVTLETDEPSRHRVVIPVHRELRVGTLNAVVSAVARHKGRTREILRGCARPAPNLRFPSEAGAQPA